MVVGHQWKEGTVPDAVWISLLCSRGSPLWAMESELSTLLASIGNALPHPLSLLPPPLQSSFVHPTSLLLSLLSSLPPTPSPLPSFHPLLAFSLSDGNVSRRREACLSLLIHAVYPGLVNLSNNSWRWHCDGLAGNCRLWAAHDSRR